MCKFSLKRQEVIVTQALLKTVEAPETFILF